MNTLRTLAGLVTAAAAMALLTACAQQGMQPDARSTANAQDDIGQMHAAFTKAFNAKDAAGMAAVYTDDAILMPPNQPEVKTQLGIETYARQAFANPASGGILLNVAETDVLAGGWAVCDGFYTMLDADGKTMDRGKFLEVLKQTDKGWKIHRESYNSDNAPAGMGAPAAGTAMAPAAATH